MPSRDPAWWMTASMGVVRLFQTGLCPVVYRETRRSEVVMQQEHAKLVEAVDWG